MRIHKHFFLVFFVLLLSFKGTSQNIMINVLSKNSGEVKIGETTFFEVTIYNTSSTKSLPVFKIKPQISFPFNLVTIPADGHVLPKGWAITSIKKGVVTLTNGTDIIPENGSRAILIAMKGISIGGPTSIIGNLFFANGISPGTLSGAATKEDNTADNSSTSTIRVQ